MENIQTTRKFHAARISVKKNQQTNKSDIDGTGKIGKHLSEMRIRDNTFLTLPQQESPKDEKCNKRLVILSFIASIISICIQIFILIAIYK